MANATSPIAPFLSTTNPSPSGLRPEDAGKGRNRTLQVHSVPRETVQCTQEGLLGTQGNTRPFDPEQAYKMRQVQNDHSSAGTSSPTPGSICSYFRYVRCFLAPTSCRPVPPVPGFCTGKKVLPLQSGPFRAEHCPEDFHKTSERSRQTAQAGRSIASRIPRRLANLGHIGGGMQESPAKSPRQTPTPGVSSKLEKIPSNAGNILPMVGTDVGPPRSDHQHPCIQTEAGCKTSQGLYKDETDIQTSSGEGTGVTTIRIHSKPSNESEAKRPEQSLEKPRHGSSKRQATTNTKGVQVNPQPVEQTQIAKPLSTAQTPPSLSNDPHRRIPDGMGRVLGIQNNPREVVTATTIIPYQHTGTDGGVPLPEETKTSEQSPHSSGFGQPDSSLLHPQRGIEIQTTEPCGSGHPSVGTEEEVVSLGFSSSGSEERHSGLPFEGFNPRDRMVSLLAIIRRDTELSSELTSGPVRNQPKPQVAVLCSSRPGSSGHSDRRIYGGLEQVGKNIPLSTNQYSPEGPGEAEDIPRYSSSSGPPLAEQPMVPSPHGDEPEEGTPSKSPALSGDTTREDLRLLCSDNPPSYMDYLSLVLARQYSKENIEIALKCLRPSSQTQYNSAWARWTSYLRHTKPESITHDTVLSFQRYLLQDCDLASTTVISYKSVLSQPLLQGFGISLNTDIDSMMSRGFHQIKPKTPTPSLTWSLDKVLEYISQESGRNSSPRFILNKTVFLIALASGARVSELAALTRDPQYLIFTEDGSAKVRPDPKFLGKNENPNKRWESWHIPALPGEDKILCPVQSLKTLLDHTKSISSGPLFLCHSTWSNPKPKPLTINGIGTAMTSLIKQSNPDSVPKAHDIRKMASSYAFMEGMQIKDMSAYSGWSGPRVFLKHYLKEIQDLRRSCVSMGQVVSR